MRLQNQVAIITGGSQGIGQAICKAFAQEGATIIIVNHNHPQRAKETELEIQQAGGKAQAISCNLLDPAAIKNLMEAVKEKYKKVDILVNNAGVVIFDKPFEEHTLEDWDYVININLRGPFLLSQAVIPLMKNQKHGKIIFISSISALVGANAGIAPYSAAKGGILAMAKTMVAELAPYNINVNCILPGAVKTTINQDIHSNPQAVKAIAERTPSGVAFMNPKDIAGAAIYLASEESRMVHGLDLIIDNGFCAI